MSLTKPQTVNAQAYDLYLRGQDHLYRLTKRSVEYSIQLFEKAIELDPRYAAAYAGSSSAYGQMYQFLAPERFREIAQELSFKALMYDNNLPRPIGRWDCRISCGASGTRPPLVHEGHRARSRRLHRALDARPHLFHGRQAGAGARPLPPGRRIKPGFYAGHLDVAQTSHRVGLVDEAKAVYAQLLELLPNYLLQNPDDSRARRSTRASSRGPGAVRRPFAKAPALVLSPGDPSCCTTQRACT